MVDRLKQILNYYHLTYSTFSDKIGIQRSNMTHLFSGRNKPSLDFVLKLSNTFPDIDLYWLLKGEGNMLKTGKEDAKIELQNTLFSENQFNNTTRDIKYKGGDGGVFNKKSEGDMKIRDDKDIKKIVVFYSDNTFELYKPN